SRLLRRSLDRDLTRLRGFVSWNANYEQAVSVLGLGLVGLEFLGELDRAREFAECAFAPMIANPVASLLFAFSFAVDRQCVTLGADIKRFQIQAGHLGDDHRVFLLIENVDWRISTIAGKSHAECRVPQRAFSSCCNASTELKSSSKRSKAIIFFSYLIPAAMAPPRD